MLNRYIPSLQIAGAASAVAFTVWWTATQGLDVEAVPALFTVWSIYALGLAGGILLRRNLRVGAALSIAHWLLIMPAFVAEDVIAYDLDNIVYAELLFVTEGTTTSLEFNWGVTVLSLIFHVGAGADGDAVGIDFVAVAALLYLVAYWGKLD